MNTEVCDKSSHNPLISIITVVYNGVFALEQTMLSVINQAYKNIEYIIIDGGSTDGTVDIIKKYEKHLAYWVSEPDKGIYDAMNKGIEKATGEWINFMNSGDCFYDKNVVITVSGYLTKPDADIIYGDTFLRESKHLLKKYPISRFKIRMPICHQSCFVKTWIHKKYNFDISYRYAADYKFFFSLYRGEYIFTYCPVIISIYDQTGMSSLNYVACLKEMAISRGTRHTLSFKIYMIFMILYVYFKKLIRVVI
jgi:glycosyltransferase involved in cell wall biosynthesis